MECADPSPCHPYKHIVNWIMRNWFIPPKLMGWPHAHDGPLILDEVIPQTKNSISGKDEFRISGQNIQSKNHNCKSTNTNYVFHHGYAEHEITEWASLWNILNFIVQTKEQPQNSKHDYYFITLTIKNYHTENRKYLSMPLAGPLHAYKQVVLPKQSNRQP